MIVIGLGTGRSGTASLAELINAQRNACCFHEMNPSCMRFSGTPRPPLNTIDEFQAILDGGDPRLLTVDLARTPSVLTYDQLCRARHVRLIGDVAFYYLTYVEAMAARNPNVRFVCMRRDIDETVASWLKKASIGRWRSKYLADRLSSWIMRAPFYESCNYWMEHDGTRWERDPLWDKCFPKFKASTMPEAIREYCKYYYAEAEQLERRLSNVFRIVETGQLSTKTCQADILNFLGIPHEDHIYATAHTNQSHREGSGRRNEAGVLPRQAAG